MGTAVPRRLKGRRSDLHLCHCSFSNEVEQKQPPDTMTVQERHGGLDATLLPLALRLSLIIVSVLEKAS